MNNKTFLFLTGRYSQKELQQVSSSQFLHKETVDLFKKLQLQALEHNIDLQLCSSFRNYERQEIIWNEKASGKRKLFNRKGELLDYHALSQEQILESILIWSAIPGASRHHWGSDFDIFDKNIKDKKEVNLTIKECEEDFKSLYEWLDNSITRSPFFRPYEQDLGGVSREPWHLSHQLLAGKFDELYTFDVFIRNIKESSILLKDLILKNSETIFNQYIKNTKK